jgi:hypothetical protein
MPTAARTLAIFALEGDITVEIERSFELSQNLLRSCAYHGRTFSDYRLNQLLVILIAFTSLADGCEKAVYDTDQIFFNFNIPDCPSGIPFFEVGDSGTILSRTKRIEICKNWIALYFARVRGVDAVRVGVHAHYFAADLI